ncbi:MAG: hypothetical protein CW742_13370 [Methanoregula sp.]|nr:MAG: hypothetical protein CW742_13370 [Methanoregula sp.]
MEEKFQADYEAIENYTLSEREFNRIKKILKEMVGGVRTESPEDSTRLIEEFDRIITKENFERAKKETDLKLLTPSYASSLLLELSRIMQPHATARYPDGDFDPQAFYTADLPLVQQFIPLCEVTAKALELTELTISILTSFPEPQP